MSKRLTITFVVILATLLLCAAIYTFFAASIDDKASYARAQASSLAERIRLFQADTGKLPATLEELANVSTTTPSFGPYVRPNAFKDPWGRKFFYRITDNGHNFVLFTLGKDGNVGGTDQDRDFQVDSPTN
jgi:general secretion pathway protein G